MCHAGADKTFTFKDGFYGGQQFASSVRFNNVTACATAQRSCATSGERFSLTKRIFDVGETTLILRAAAIPLSVGRPISIKIRSGLQSFRMLNCFQSL